MSKILPYIDDDNEVTNEIICPRYEKYLKRIGGKNNVHQSNRDFKDESTIIVPTIRSSKINSKRLKKRNSLKHRNSLKRDNDSISIGSRKSLTTTKRNRPLRSRSIFVKIRQKSRNFGIRCRTSVDLWRQWIKTGIGWDRPMQTKLPFKQDSADKSKRFLKKTIINEVIPEEEEEPDENTSKGNNNNLIVNNEQEDIGDKQTSNKFDINFKSKKHDPKSNGTTMVNGQKVIKKTIQSSKSNTLNQQQQHSTIIKSVDQTNHNTTGTMIGNNHLKSIKQKFDNYQTKSTPNTSNNIVDNVPSQSKTIINDDSLINLNKSTKKSSIRRAFNKLKLFF